MSSDGERTGEGSQKSSVGSGLARTGGAERSRGRTRVQLEAGLEDSRGGGREGSDRGPRKGGARHPGPQALTGAQTMSGAVAEEGELAGLASAAAGLRRRAGKAVLSWCEGTVTTSCPFVFISQPTLQVRKSRPRG